MSKQNNAMFDLMFEQGGQLLWFILATSIVMWSLILERYSYYFWVLPKYRQKLLDQWQRTHTPSSTLNQQLKNSLITEFTSQSQRYLFIIHTLVDILPLLGLFGTISGMINVFEVMTVFGTGNARGMAAGISEAMITTMAGLVTALSGLYFCTSLNALMQRQINHFATTLNHGINHESPTSS